MSAPEHLEGWETQDALFVLEDDSARARRRPHIGIQRRGDSKQITIALHRVRAGREETIDSQTYESGSREVHRRAGGRSRLALELLDRHSSELKASLLVAGPDYGQNLTFVEALVERGISFAMEIRPGAYVSLERRTHDGREPVGELVKRASLRRINLTHPLTNDHITYGVARLGSVGFASGASGTLFVGQGGAIPGLHRGTIIAIGWPSKMRPEELLRAVCWTRWIRPAVRRGERPNRAASVARTWSSFAPASGLRVRANISLATAHDREGGGRTSQATESFRGVLGASSRTLNVAELFAGAGGMGLGFALARGGHRYRLVYSGEVHPIYVNTLQANHRELQRILKDDNLLPATTAPTDLRSPKAQKAMLETIGDAGGVDVLIGGPPCQGFSMSNRNSGWSHNPNNRLVNVFVRFVEAVRPAVFLMENVQGILWAAKHDSRRPTGVVEHLACRFARSGYSVFPKLLDAVWYGVPQFRSRFFLLGLRGDLGYRPDDFGDWGPFPVPSHGPGRGSPYVSVADAISDLPRIRNGHEKAEIPYAATPAGGAGNSFLQLMRRGAVRGVITDHVTSRHSDYVLERYRRIPPGGNWSSIREAFTNYADVDRTHSNIYRRLALRDPSVTIGHYRKAMLIHPTQTRGLSLREASRLQSFPDWFRFSGTPSGGEGGLVHKQQQLANAVCPLVSKAIAEFILQL